LTGHPYQYAPHTNKGVFDMPSDLQQRLGDMGVVSILVVDKAEDALRVGEALLSAGMAGMEVTFRTAAAAEAIGLLAKKLPEATVGAGTVLNTGNLLAARDAGAQFVVTPGLNPTVVQKAIDIDLPIFPGVMTPGEVEKGLSFGLTALKFFPAEQAGGPAMMKALSGPYAHTGVKFIPTGGVNEQNLTAYLSLPIVLACGGTWIAKSDLVKKQDWTAITQIATETAAKIKELRG
jgi:2-dehydro-3-deoxyphosphogluconate aldolase / (4S)-4-hydroxy-2-oxoglutarate aldolase